MTTYCAPCLADLALVREAATAVNGTASCMAHAVLLTHPTDNAQRRLTRLGELRTLVEGKLLTASLEDQPALELLVQEYTLAGAMDMSVPLREIAGDRTPRPPKARRQRGERSDRGPRPEGSERGPRPERGERGPRPERTEQSAAEGAPTDSAPTVETAPAPTVVESAPAPAVVESAPAPAVVESAPAPAVVESAPAAPAPEPVSASPES